MLTQKFWLTQEGSFAMTGTEHADFAIGVMLKMPPESRVPRSWSVDGVPESEIAAALERGASRSAIDWLTIKRGDARLYVMKEYGWVRTMKSVWNLWFFDDATADMVRNNSGYWIAQRSSMNQYDLIDVEEFKTRDRYSINVKKLLDGARPQVLKNLAMGRSTEDVEEDVVPSYSSAKYSEEERRKLYGRTGDNPRHKR